MLRICPPLDPCINVSLGRGGKGLAKHSKCPPTLVYLLIQFDQTS